VYIQIAEFYAAADRVAAVAVTGMIKQNHPFDARIACNERIGQRFEGFGRLTRSIENQYGRAFRGAGFRNYFRTHLNSDAVSQLDIEFHYRTGGLRRCVREPENNNQKNSENKRNQSLAHNNLLSIL